MSLEQLQNDIIELQTRVHFQEDTIHKLDSELIVQNHTIDKLLHRITELEGRLEQIRDEQAATQKAAEDRPPHY